MENVKSQNEGTDRSKTKFDCMNPTHRVFAEHCTDEALTLAIQQLKNKKI
jgi:hypothetical protein